MGVEADTVTVGNLHRDGYCCYWKPSVVVMAAELWLTVILSGGRVLSLRRLCFHVFLPTLGRVTEVGRTNSFLSRQTTGGTLVCAEC